MIIIDLAIFTKCEYERDNIKPDEECRVEQVIALRVCLLCEWFVFWSGSRQTVVILSDKGPDFISLALAEWAGWHRHTVKLEFIQPGKPTQNVFIERFNGAYRTEILDFYQFRTLNEVREITRK